MKHYLLLVFFFLVSSCYKEVLFDTEARVNLWLYHEGAEMPIVVEGNTNSKIFILLLHGGPGGTSQTFNSFFTPFSDLLEKDYAMVYWDQRNSGLSRGEWDRSKLTIEQHTEDLDQVIELLKFKFGSDISIFLSGQSWGAYLGQAYLLDQERQSKIKAWINIDGLCHRNRNIKDALHKIREIANEEIANNRRTEDWTILLGEVQVELDKNIQNYNANSENIVFSFIRRAERIIAKSDLLEYDQGSSFQSTYQNNAHPFLLGANKRTITFLIPKMFDFDNTLDNDLSNITIPSIFLYGYYDVRTPPAQAAYVMEKITTDQSDQRLVILPKSDHSSIGNEAVQLAEEVIAWVERYR